MQCGRGGRLMGVRDGQETGWKNKQEKRDGGMFSSF